MKECSKFPLPAVFQNTAGDIDPSHSDYNIFCNMLQNHSSITLFTTCVYQCLINIYILNFIFVTKVLSVTLGSGLRPIEMTVTFSDQ